MSPLESNETLCWSVTALVHAIADTLKARFAAIAVRGEISSFTRAASGHCYFTLKDTTSQIRCAMFQRAANMLTFEPAHGDEVELQGRLAVYEQRGELQFIVESMRPVGQGQLLEQFQRLKQKLGNEGLFDTERKRPIPPYPQTIGIISSLQAAALHDVLTALQRRAPHVRVIIYPASVQGKAATTELVSALQKASNRKEVDTLLLCRGGGSLEDLWSFNEEAVIRAIAACTIPIISGVGHETDFTLADFAADLRAPTPTAAAELAAPPRQLLLETLARQTRQLTRQTHAQLNQLAQRIDHAALALRQPTALLHTQKQRLQHAALQLRLSTKQTLTHLQHPLTHLQHRLPQACTQLLHNKQTQLNPLLIRWQYQTPEHLLRQHHHQLNQQKQQLATAATQQLQHNHQRLHNLTVRLTALNPAKVLSRGYAWVSDTQGKALSSVSQLHPGQHIHTQFADGQATAQIQHVEPHLTIPGEEP